MRPELFREHQGESAQAVLHGHAQNLQVSISNWQIPPPLPVAV